MQVGDQAYHLFRSSMTTPMPSSTWLANSAPYGAQSADIFLTSLQNSIASTQVNQVKIYAVSLNPGPVAKQANGVELLPRSSELFVNLVVADTGNQPAAGLTITASISMADAGGRDLGSRFHRPPARPGPHRAGPRAAHSCGGGSGDP